MSLFYRTSRRRKENCLSLSELKFSQKHKRVVVCRDFILCAVATFWAMSLVSLSQFIKKIGIRRSRLTMGRILVVCLAGAPVSVAEEADAGVTVFVTEAASVLCLWSVEAVALFSAEPSLCDGLCQLLLARFEVFG